MINYNIHLVLISKNIIMYYLKTIFQFFVQFVSIILFYVICNITLNEQIIKSLQKHSSPQPIFNTSHT